MRLISLRSKIIRKKSSKFFIIQLFKRCSWNVSVCWVLRAFLQVFNKKIYQIFHSSGPDQWLIDRHYNNILILAEFILMLFWQKKPKALKAVLRIRIRRILMFLGLPDPDPLLLGTVQIRIIMPKIEKPCSRQFLAFLWLFIFKWWCKCSFKR
jgi:hypothetical protein